MKLLFLVLAGLIVGYLMFTFLPLILLIWCYFKQRSQVRTFIAKSAHFFRHTHDGYNCESALKGDAWNDEWIDELEKVLVTK